MKAKHKPKDDIDYVNQIMGLELCNIILPMVYYEYAEKLGIRDIVQRRVRFIERSAIKNSLVADIVKGDYAFHTSVVQSEDRDVSLYIIVFDYAENYNQIQSMLNYGPLQYEFYATILIGLIHEFRHIMQFEDMVPDIRYDGTEDSLQLAETDAINFADDFAESVIMKNIVLFDEIIKNYIECANLNMLFLAGSRDKHILDFMQIKPNEVIK